MWSSRFRSRNTMILHHLEIPHRCYHPEHMQLTLLNHVTYTVFVDMPGWSRMWYLISATAGWCKRFYADNSPAPGTACCETWTATCAGIGVPTGCSVQELPWYLYCTKCVTSHCHSKNSTWAHSLCCKGTTLFCRKFPSVQQASTPMRSAYLYSNAGRFWKHYKYYF